MKKRHEDNNSEQPTLVGSEENGANEVLDGTDGNVKQCEAGKFKNEHQLRRAYEALEAEFTRKSQQLARLSREHEQLLEEKRQMQFENQKAAALDEFIRKYPKAAEKKAELQERMGDDAQGYGQALSAAYMDILDREHQTKESLLNDEDFIDACVLDQRISDEVIRRYLISRVDVPSSLRGGYFPVMKRN